MDRTHVAYNKSGDAMEIMRRLGEGVAKKPIIPFAILIVVTVAMLGAIAVNPPSFDMEEGSFRPDNEIMRAQTLISESFTSTASVMSMADAHGAGDDIITKASFLQVLGYEKVLADMEYTDTNDDCWYYSDLPLFRIVSPVSVISEATINLLISQGMPITLPDPSLFPNNHDYLIAYYDTLIGVIGSPAVDDALLKLVTYGTITNPAGAMMRSLLTSDIKIVDGPTPLTGTVSASGCMISLMMMDDALAVIKGGEGGFEKDVIGAAKGYNAACPGGPGIKAVGMETMMSEIGEMARADISKLLPIALAVIIILLLIIYRDASDTLMALLGLVIAIIWTFGIAALAGIGMTTISIAVPILILALGIDYSLHLVFRYREERGGGNEPKSAIGITMGSVGRALVLATVTTAIAFLSYLTSEMAALADFGLLCAIGIVCAFGSMMLLIPTTQVLRDRRAEKKGKDPDASKRYRKPENEGKDTLGKIAGAGGKIAAKSPWAVLGILAVVVIAGGYSATNLSYDFDMYEFIPEGTEAHDTIMYLSDNYMTTTSTTSVLVYADPWDISTIKAIEESLNNMANDPIKGLKYQGPGPPDSDSVEYLGTILSKFRASPESAGVPNFHMLYDMAFNANGTLKGTTAAEQTALDNLKVMFSMPGLDIVVSSVVSSENENITRFILSMTTEVEGDNNAILAMRDAVNAACAPLSDNDVKFIATGQYIILAATMTEMNKSQMTSLMITIALVMLILTIVMYYSHRSLLLGAMATVPTLISVIMVWGTMAAIDMPLNVMTLTIASLAVGLGVTYGIHISNRYVTELKSGLSAEDSIVKTMRETGKGVFAAAVTTVAGFGVMVFSKILPMYQFGIITALAIGFGYIGSIFVLPALLVLWGRRAGPRYAAAAAGETKAKAKHPEWDRHSMVTPGKPKDTSNRVYRKRGRAAIRQRRPKI